MIAGIVFSFQYTFAQWVSLNSNTISNLNDVDFYNEDFGIAVGNSGTIVETTDGGNTWTDLTSPTTDDLTNVSILNPDTFFVSNGISTTQYLWRYNSTTGWQVVLVLGPPYQSTIFDHNAYAVSNHIYESPDGGANWGIQYDVPGTTTFDDIKFTNASVGHAGGNVSGIITYSTYVVRTVNAGDSWWYLDVFSFPNANGFSALDFPKEDTGYIFAPYYNFFSPTDSSQLWKLTNFSLGPDINPVDSLWSFNTSVLITTFHDYVNACKFLGTDTGYAVGNKGFIYRTTDGGIDWTNDYEGTLSLRGLKMINSLIGYAVGDSGLILKREIGTSTETGQQDIFNAFIYPNPAKDVAILKWTSSKEQKGNLQITDALGRKVYDLPSMQINSGMNSLKLDVSKFQQGIYFVQLNDGISSTILKMNLLE